MISDGKRGQMGGIGSGGYNGARRPIVEGCRCLNINRMVKEGLISSRRTAWDPTWRNAFYVDGGSIRYEAEAHDPHNAFLRVQHYLEHGWDSRGYRITLTRTRPRYGGWRWWFICPQTGRRVTKLYIPPGGRKFLSRHAYGLKYFSQSIDGYSRASRKSQKLQGMVDKDGGYYYKRKRMHQTTFDRIVDKIDAAEEWANYYFDRRVERLLASHFLIAVNKGKQP